MFYTSPIFLRQQANSRSPQWMPASFEPILPLNKMMFSCWVGFCVTLEINQRHCSTIFQILWPSTETSSILNSTLLPSSCWFVALFESSPIHRISCGIHQIAMKHFFLTLFRHSVSLGTLKRGRKCCTSHERPCRERRKGVQLFRTISKFQRTTHGKITKSSLFSTCLVFTSEKHNHAHTGAFACNPGHLVPESDVPIATLERTS